MESIPFPDMAKKFNMYNNYNKKRFLSRISGTQNRIEIPNNIF